MEDILVKLGYCVEFGKVDKNAPYPPDMKGQDGADELTKQAIEQGISAAVILEDALVAAMNRVGQKFTEKKIFIPQMLMSAKAMNAAVAHLKPFFNSGEITRKGKFIIATVKGDLHDIGKNLVKMAIEGAGWEVIDLGVDVPTEKVLETIQANPDAKIGLSALLTTTMGNMQVTVESIKSKYPSNAIIIGGAPVNEEFKTKIGADFYAPDPQSAVSYLNR
ncbi:MAG: corrinoid protein [Marinilabiliaceae bacterium]|nr:corrinoid protein [Marinilabiliaceae bacterium]